MKASRWAQVNVRMPADLRKRMLEEGSGRNWSMIVREAIERVLDGSFNELARTLELRDVKERLRKIRDLASG